MAWTRGAYVTRIRELADAVGSDRWSDPLIRGLLASVHRQGWHRLLDANPALRMAVRTVMTDTDGRFALSDLQSGSGDTLEAWRRIELVADACDVAWYEVDYRDAPFGVSGTDITTRVWYRLGDQIQLLPVVANATRRVTVTHLPPLVDGLSSDTVAVTWPEGHESVLAWRTAAHVLMTGGAESDAAAQLEVMARDAEASMLAQVARTGAQPMRWRFPDDAAMWGL